MARMNHIGEFHIRTHAEFGDLKRCTNATIKYATEHAMVLKGVGKDVSRPFWLQYTKQTSTLDEDFILVPLFPLVLPFALQSSFHVYIKILGVVLLMNMS